jgi:xanthine dehydrogenase YagS FAD-binding subunit
MRNFAYVLPESIDQAQRAAKEKGALLKAGGIDLLDLMKGDIIQPDRLVNLLSVKGPELRAITRKDDGLHIGALATLADLAAHAEAPPVLAHAAGSAATPQIRNVATVGGNIAQRPRCWYFRSATFPCARKGGNTCYTQKGESKYHALFDNGDCAVVTGSSLSVPLVALDATVVTTKRRIPIEKFFVPTTVDITREHVLEPGEIITEVVIPAAARGWKNAFQEAGERESQDWSLVSAAVTLQMDGNTVKAARVVLGAVAAVPYRVPAAEAALVGKTITEANAQQVAEVAFAKARPLSDNAYKVPLGKTILKRAILAAAGGRESAGG